MKTWKKVVSLLLAAALVIPGVDFGTLLQVSAASDARAVSGGSGTVVTPEQVVTPGEVVTPGQVQGIKVTAPYTTVTAGDGVQLTAEVTPDNAEIKDVEWKSSNTDYATVSTSGYVQTQNVQEAIGKTVTITATAKDGSGVQGTIQITIKSSNPVTEIGIVVSPDNGTTVKPGESVYLTAIVTPSDAKQDVTWSSSNDDWATVDGTGKVTALAAGAGQTVTITATATDASNVKGTIQLTIATIPVQSVTVTAKQGSATTVTVGTNVELVATVNPSNATDKVVTWSSSDTAKATVANGVVTTKAAGTVEISATAGGVTGKITITINPAPVVTVPVTDLTLTPATATVAAGGSVQLTATIVPSNATNKTVNWTSSNNAWATVDAKGKVTALAAGAGQTVTITATAAGNANAKKTAKITIQAAAKPPVQTVAVTGMTLTPATASVDAGGTVKLNATILPTNATNRNVTWTSSNNAWATVANGVVTTKAAGAGQKVTITAIAAGNTSIKKTAVITINKPVVANTKVTSVTVGVKKGSSKTVNAGGKVNLTATVAPATATKKDVTWSIAKKDQKYATVNSKTGVVTTKKAGAGHKVTVTATAKDGSNKSGTITITIKKVAVKKVTIKGSKSVKAGKKVTLKANVTPKNATNTAVTWSIDKKFKRYASVNKKGVVTTKKAGKGKTIKVTATSKDNKKKKATISIKIKK